jgi:Flp pilus assembly protein TadG
LRTGRAEGGTALVGTLVGFAIFFVLLLLAVQVAVRLYATSALTAAATQAAETVAQDPDPVAGVSEAQQDARSRLGTFGASETSFDWEEVDGNRVVLKVTADSPDLLRLVPGWGHITRTVTVRTERFR